MTGRTNDMLRVALSRAPLVVGVHQLADHPDAVGLAGDVHLAHRPGADADAVLMWSTWSTASRSWRCLFIYPVRPGHRPGSGDGSSPTRRPRCCRFSRCRSPAPGIAAPQWHFDFSDRVRTVLSEFLDDPRWIAMLAAVLTVSGPWLPARWRHWWWTWCRRSSRSTSWSARSSGPRAAGPCGRLVRRRAGDPGKRHPASGYRSTMRSHDGQTRVRL